MFSLTHASSSLIESWVRDRVLSARAWISKRNIKFDKKILRTAVFALINSANKPWRVFIKRFNVFGKSQIAPSLIIKKDIRALVLIPAPISFLAAQSSQGWWRREIEITNRERYFPTSTEAFIKRRPTINNPEPSLHPYPTRFYLRILFPCQGAARKRQMLTYHREPPPGNVECCLMAQSGKFLRAINNSIAWEWDCEDSWE